MFIEFVQSALRRLEAMESDHAKLLEQLAKNSGESEVCGRESSRVDRNGERTVTSFSYVALSSRSLVRVEDAADRVDRASADLAADVERWRAIQLAELRNLFVRWAAANVALWTEVLRVFATSSTVINTHEYIIIIIGVNVNE